MTKLDLRTNFFECLFLFLFDDVIISQMTECANYCSTQIRAIRLLGIWVSEIAKYPICCYLCWAIAGVWVCMCISLKGKTCEPKWAKLMCSIDLCKFNWKFILLQWIIHALLAFVLICSGLYYSQSFIGKQWDHLGSFHIHISHWPIGLV